MGEPASAVMTTKKDDLHSLLGDPEPDEEDGPFVVVLGFLVNCALASFCLFCLVKLIKWMWNF